MTPPRIFDIALHGTSLTSIVGVDWQVVFRSRMLADESLAVRLYDYGSSGANSGNVLADAGSGMKLKPWAAVFEAGTNDAIQSVPVATYTANLQALINQYRAASPETLLFLMTMNPLVSPPVSAPVKAALPTYYTAMRNLAAATPNVTLIDNYPNYGTPTTVQIPDGIHPSLATQSAVLVPNLVSVFAPLMG